ASTAGASCSFSPGASMAALSRPLTRRFALSAQGPARFKHCGATGQTSMKQSRGGSTRGSQTQLTETPMNRGIECAFWGALGKDPELKTSKTGNPFTTMNVVVPVGTSDEGKDVGQWLRVACFGEIATAIASRAKKGDRVYVEGSLTMTQWNDTHGEVKHGLNVAAWKVERVASIGKNRQRQDHGNTATQQKQDNGRGKYDFDDELPI